MPCVDFALLYSGDRIVLYNCICYNYFHGIYDTTCICENLKQVALKCYLIPIFLSLLFYP